MSQTSRTSTNEDYQAIEMEMWRLWRMNKIEESERDPTLHHAKEMAARIERLQRLWDAWGRSRGYATDSKPYGAFLDALKVCEDHGDLLPLEGSNGR